MRGTVTWLLAAAIGAVVVAGVVDAVRRSTSHSGPAGALTTTATAAETTNGGAQLVASGPPERLPPCRPRQLRLAMSVGGPRAEFVLRRVSGQPCHQRRSRVRLTLLDHAGDRVPVSTSNFYSERATAPADFANGFELVILNPYIALCDPQATFTAVAHVGPYVARRTVSGTEISCRE